MLSEVSSARLRQGIFKNLHMIEFYCLIINDIIFEKHAEKVSIILGCGGFINNYGFLK
jgi:hypothetical protein